MVRAWAALLLFLSLLGCGPRERIELPLTLTVAANADHGEPVIEARWLGERLAPTLDRRVLPGGAVQYSTTLAGAPLRLLPVRIAFASEGEDATTWYDTIEVVRLDEPLHYAADPAYPGNLRRVPYAGDIVHNKRLLRLGVAAHLAWAVVALGLVAWLVRTAPAAPPAVPGRWRWWWDGPLWLVLAVAITWPAVLAGPHLMVGRHFDLPGTIWALDAIPRLAEGFQDPLTGGPGGASYRAFDSYTLVPIGLLFSWLDPTRLQGFVQVVGVAASGWAATAAARALGARGGFAVLGGVAFVGSGLAATALLEGHAYHLLNPWLPLFTWAWWRATRAGGQVRHGLAAGLCFGLAVLTTGYLALSGLALLAGIGLSGWKTDGLAWRPAAAALLAVLPAVSWVGLSLSGHTSETFHDAEAIAASATTLAGLAGATAQDDVLGHSFAPAPPPTLLALAAMAPLVLRGRASWKPLAITGLVALALSFGPRLSASALEVLGPSPLAALWQLPGADLLRFPARLGWAGTLCLGLLAARVASELAPGPRGRALLVCAVAIDVLAYIGMPWRQGTLAAGSSSAFLEGEGPVFSVLPEGVGDGGELDSWLSALSCYSQTVHGRPISDDCVTVPVRGNTRFLLGREVGAALLAGRPADARSRLVEAGFTAVAWQPDLFSEQTRLRLAASLEALDDRPTRRTDGGQHLVRFDLDTSPGASGEADAGLAFRSVPGAPEQARRIDLLLRAPRWVDPPLRVAATLESGSGAQDRVLSGLATVPGDWPGDSGWLARWEEPGPGPYRLVLYDEDTPFWSGRIEPAMAVDRLELTLLRGEDGTLEAHPVGLSPPSRSLNLRASTGRVAMVGWLCWLLAFVVLGGQLRRRWPPPSAR